MKPRRGRASTRYDRVMRVVSGTVVGGKVVVDGVPLDEGAVVTVVAREDDETFDVTAEDEAALLAAIEEADRGNLIAAEDVIGRLRRRP